MTRPARRPLDTAGTRHKPPEREGLRALLAEVAASGVTFDDARLDSLTIEIDREVWERVKQEAAK